MRGSISGVSRSGKDDDDSDDDDDDDEDEDSDDEEPGEHFFTRIHLITQCPFHLDRWQRGILSFYSHVPLFNGPHLQVPGHNFQAPKPSR